jgi:hypothetical protein
MHREEVCYPCPPWGTACCCIPESNFDSIIDGILLGEHKAISCDEQFKAVASNNEIELIMNASKKKH